MTRFNESIGRLQALAVQLERAAEQMRGAGTPIADIASRFTAAGRTIEQAGQTFTQTERRISELATTLDQSVKRNNEVWAEYSRRFENADEQLGKVVRGLAEGADAYQRRIGEFVNQIDEKLGNAIIQFGRAIDELSEVFGDGTPIPPRPAGAGTDGERSRVRLPAAGRV